MFDRHTTDNIFNMLVKFLDALYGKWRTKLISMSSDGENTMTGRHTDLVTRMIACTENPVLRIWCALHQIDMVVKSTTVELADDEWIMFARSFSIFLHAQANLITSMAVKCPKKTNRWMHMGRLLQFFKDHRRRIVAYVETHRPEQMPTSVWWVITFTMSSAINAINVMFVILENQSLMIA
jgi:negative regulator of replication initiation